MRSPAIFGRSVFAGVVALVSIATAHADITTLYDFKGGSDSQSPWASLISDPEGNLYGTTYQGGAYCYCGTVFKLAPDGSDTVLHAFTNRDGDGARPVAGLIRDKAGNLYGTTTNGGHGKGVVFKVAPNGRETVLHSFQGKSDGAYPWAGLLQDEAGNLYDTTERGGGDGNFGTVFKLSPDGTETVLHAFGHHPHDGRYSYAGLMKGRDGELYGTTFWGGDSNCTCGTVFRLKKK